MNFDSLSLSLSLSLSFSLFLSFFLSISGDFMKRINFRIDDTIPI